MRVWAAPPRPARGSARGLRLVRSCTAHCFFSSRFEHSGLSGFGYSLYPIRHVFGVTQYGRTRALFGAHTHARDNTLGGNHRTHAHTGKQHTNGRLRSRKYTRSLRCRISFTSDNERHVSRTHNQLVRSGIHQHCTITHPERDSMQHPSMSEHSQPTDSQMPKQIRRKQQAYSAARKQKARRQAAVVSRRPWPCRASRWP